MARPTTDPKDRFREKYTVDPIKGCWLWMAYIDGDGYGKFRLGKTITAHRAAWLLFRGPIPEGLEPDHLCLIKRCANPDHLELVTHQVNIQRGWDARARFAERLHSPEHREDLSLHELMNRVQEHLKKEAETRKVDALKRESN
jgi:HNH endonuclease